jgi:excisionase family DNA binding protein
MSEPRHPLSVAEAAARAGVSEKTVRRAIKASALPVYRNRSARRLVVFSDDLDAWAFEPFEPASPQTPRRPSATRRGSALRGSVARLRAIEAGEA